MPLSNLFGLRPELAPTPRPIDGTTLSDQSATIDEITANIADLDPVPARDPLAALLQCLTRGECTGDDSGDIDLDDGFVFTPGLGTDGPPLGDVDPPTVDVDDTFEGPIGVVGAAMPEGPIGVIGTGGVLPLAGLGSLGGLRTVATGPSDGPTPADGPTLTPTLPTIVVPHGPQELTGLDGTLPLAVRDPGALAGLTPIAIDGNGPAEVGITLDIEVADRPIFDFIRNLREEPLSLSLFDDNVADAVDNGYRLGITDLGLG